MLRIYHNNRCSKSKNGLAHLQERGKIVTVKNYMQDGISKEEIHEILAKLNCSVHDILRDNEAEYKEFKTQNLTDEEWIERIIAHPKLLQRPIVINNDKAVIARPHQKIDEIL